MWYGEVSSRMGVPSALASRIAPATPPTMDARAAKYRRSAEKTGVSRAALRRPARAATRAPEMSGVRVPVARSRGGQRAGIGGGGPWPVQQAAGRGPAGERASGDLAAGRPVGAFHDDPVGAHQPEVLGAPDRLEGDQR